MQRTASVSWDKLLIWHFVLAILLATTIVAVATAPAEQTMGDAQRVLYVHVAVAWLSLLGFVVMAATATMYLLCRKLSWDHWSQSAGELGWLSCSLTLITGSMWAHAAWGTWWIWEPRLLSSFILWALYSSYLLVRSSIPDAHRRARLSGIVAILGVIDVPLVLMATRWFRGMHPVAPEMEPGMRIVLLVTAATFTLLFATLFVHRREQIELEFHLLQLEHGLETPASWNTTSSGVLRPSLTTKLSSFDSTSQSEITTELC
jgi:heme exporter protein C